MNTNVLIIEDEEGIKLFLEEILIDEGFTVQSATTGTQGLQLVSKMQPDVVLLDLKLPDIAGEDVCRKIKEQYPETIVIMTTGKDAVEDVADGLDLGADDYITKPFSEEILMARIKARLREQGKHNHIMQVADLVINTDTLQVSRGDMSIELTPQEFKLLTYLVTNKNRVLSREMILSRIWHHTQDVETRVVDVYIGYLRKKIDADQKKALIHSKRGFGYMIKE